MAQRPSVCVVGKARGITGSPAPVGDPYDIDFVAHEVGHQFGANHTFNGVTAASEGNCTTGTRAPGAAVEPGSGSTIMAYAGICGVMDVQSNSDDHFHAISIAEMMGHITGAGNCVAGVNNNNTPPVADAGINYTIPRGTPFVLKGSATDANNDTLTYCWEQTNNEISTQPPLNTNTTGPNFRSNPPSTSPNRYMPSLATVISNLPSKWEVLPNVGRTMNFALTVRDNRTPNGGQTSRDDMQVTTVAAAGPFVVTSQNAEQQVLVPGSTQTVTWDVAGTTGNGVNTANVRILFSTDNGVTFPIVLSESTANDGSHEVTLPNVTAPYCRIMVEAVGNIFFNVNSKNIALGNYTYQMQNVCEDYFFNAGIQIPESANQYTGYSLNIPDNFTLSDVNINPVITHPNMGNIYLGVRHPSMTTGVTRLASASCAGSANLDLVYDSQGAAVNCANTTSGAATLPLDTLNAYNGLSSQGSWVFFLVDAVVGDNVRGTWESITLNLCRLELVPTLAVENFGLDQFVVYPNPNNGEFNVKFNSSSTTKIEITLHDIQGRSIFNQSFENTGVFDQKLKLDNVQSGIYIVTVQDGPIKEVRRIVVE